jgi:hypothetical protein
LVIAAKWPKMDRTTRKILILCSDSALKELLSDLFRNNRCEFVSDPEILSQVTAILEQIENRKPDILIITNFGIPIDLVIRYLNNLPMKVNYKVILLTGYLNEILQGLCIIKGIQYLAMPTTIEMLQSII